MLENMKLIIQILPLIIELIKAIENAIPASGKGKEKLEFAKSVLDSAIPNIENIWASLEKIIGATVAVLNKTGWFRDSSSK